MVPRMIELSGRFGWWSRGGWNCRVEVEIGPKDDETVSVRELIPRMMED